MGSGGGSWSSVSDRNVKENFTPVDGRAVLDKLASIPVETWNYKSQNDDIRHIGPMAQERHITAVDADGISMAAIQGLYEIAKQKDGQIAALEGRLSALEARLAE